MENNNEMQFSTFEEKYFKNRYIFVATVMED